MLFWVLIAVGVILVGILIVISFEYFPQNKQFNVDNIIFCIDLPGNGEIEQVLMKNLKEYNEAQIGTYERIPFTIHAKDEEGNVLAGASGVVRVNYDCKLEMVAVEQSHRAYGLGTRMLGELENFALKHQCKHILIEIADFQSKEFYKKHGFEIVATIEEGFLGRDLHIMQKNL